MKNIHLSSRRKAVIYLSRFLIYILILSLHKTMTSDHIVLNCGTHTSQNQGSYPEQLLFQWLGAPGRTPTYSLRTRASGG